jgi:hypothetical protein
MKREIWIYRCNSESVGSCNGCNAHSTPSGIAPHAVTEVMLGIFTFRLCDGCLAVLTQKLQRALAES